MNRSLALVAAAVALLAGCTSTPPTSAGGGCLYPSLQCGDRCVDGRSDPANCGLCGNVCAAGTSCCNSHCVDVHAADAGNCGACGHRCPTGGSCSAGTCECPLTSPTACGASPGACVDLTIDPGNCGTCGEACQGAGVAGTDATCTSGACVCAGTATATDCGGNPRCVNTNLDENNCGACGHACTGAASTCCSRSCVDTQTDEGNCGACGHACGSGESCCAGACVDLQTSGTSCGTCGHACTGGRACSAATCVCSGATALTCGTSCCAGDACCGASTCQTAHSNGLGGTFYDCNPLYAPGSTTETAARAAGASWNAAATTYAGLCDGSCVGFQTGVSCAVWCYDPSNFRGEVALRTGDNSCTVACNGFFGPVSTVTVTTWQ